MKGNDFPALPGLDEPRKVSESSDGGGSKAWEAKGFLDVVKGTAKMKISNRKDSAREDVLEDGPDDSEAKSPASSQQDVPSVTAKEAPKSPEPTASVVTSSATSQVPSASIAVTSKPAKSHSSQSSSTPSSHK